MGFIPKSSPSQVVLQALRLVLSGGVYVPHQLLADGPPRAARIPSLTPRQLKVLSLLLEGKSNKAIGKELHITEGTAKIHVSAILQVLNVPTRAKAVAMAQELGLAAPSG